MVNGQPIQHLKVQSVESFQESLEHEMPTFTNWGTQWIARRLWDGILKDLIEKWQFRALSECHGYLGYKCSEVGRQATIHFKPDST